jgi:hypothetical protein
MDDLGERGVELGFVDGVATPRSERKVDAPPGCRTLQRHPES